MAVVRARSAPPYALILFVFLWVVSTALAVTFYLSSSRLEEDAATNQKKYDSIFTMRDQPVVSKLNSEKLPGSNATSALGLAEAQIEALKKAVGAPDKTTPEIVAPGNGLVAQALSGAGTAGNLLDAVKSLSTQLADATKTNDAMQTSLKSLQAQVDLDKKDYDAAAGSSNQSSETFKTQLAAATTAQAAAEADKLKTVEDAEKNLSAAKDQAEAGRRENVILIEQMKEQIAQKDEKIAALTDDIEKLRPTSKTNVGREPAGNIVRAATGSGEVYINLGRRDHITAGLTFAVYDPGTGVRFDSDEAAAGKGSIEVLEVGDTESLCRITNTTKGQAVQSGDLIANPVYQHDKNRKFHFVVIGDFDLDGDGINTAAEHDRLVRLVQSWGGVIDDKISTQTDFLVAGSRPLSAYTQSDDAATPGSVVDSRSKKQQDYDATIAEAKESTVPILNSNRFLALVGYYNTTVVR